MEETTEESLRFKWKPPACDQQHGEITQYEYLFTGLDDWVKDVVRRSSTARKRVQLDDLHPGTRYRFQVRAYSAAGPGPWSEHIDVRTSGSEVGPPRELHTVKTEAESVVVTWLPPHPIRGQITAYRLRYRDRNTDVPVEVILRDGDLACDAVRSAPSVVESSLCYRMDGLNPATTYAVEVQARAESGTWGDWSPKHYVTTKEGTDFGGGILTLVSSQAESMKVRWNPPGVLSNKVRYYLVSIKDTYKDAYQPPDATFNITRQRTDYQFENLKPATPYNVTVEGGAGDRKLWFISRIFETTEKVDGLLSWLSAPTDLELIEKSDTMLHVTWKPPEILLPAFQQLVTHYRVTLARFHPDTGLTDEPKTFTVPRPGNRIRFDGLIPDTPYNITVQAGTAQGYGEILWGTYSTLAPPGTPHILRLLMRTPKSLHVAWTPVWPEESSYTLIAKPLYSNSPLADLGRNVVVDDVEGGAKDFVIRGLTPETVYNVTLHPRDSTHVAYGVYATLPPGAFVVRNLRVCEETGHALSMSWDPVDHVSATHYQVRYAGPEATEWTEMPQKSRYELRCPGDPCKKLCYLLFNLDEDPGQLTVQVRAYVEGSWNRWKSAVRAPSPEPKALQKACCIVPPHYFVDHIGLGGTQWKVTIRPVPNDTTVLRYWVIVDRRETPGPINETELTDKVTADKLGIPYYVAGSFDRHTLKSERQFPIGDGEVRPSSPQFFLLSL